MCVCPGCTDFLYGGGYMCLDNMVHNTDKSANKEA